MDISAFETTAAGGGPEPVRRDVMLLLDDDLQGPASSLPSYCLIAADRPPQLKAVIAIVKHVGRLFVFVLVLGMCVVIYCFALSWICMFWLQTRLFFVASSFLRHCMDEPTAPRHQWIDINKPVRAPNTHASRVEAESPPPEPRSTWAGQPVSDTEGTSLDAKPPERAQSTCASGIELQQYVRPASSGSSEPQSSRKDSAVPQNGRVAGEDVWDRLLKREREIQAEIGSPAPAQHDEIDQYAGAEEEGLQRFEGQSLSANVVDSSPAESDNHDGALSVAPDSIVDDIDKHERVNTANNPFKFTAEQMAEAARFAAEATRGGDKSKGRSAHAGRSGLRAAAVPQRKLFMEEQKVQAQRNWMASMTPGGLSARSTVKGENVSQTQQSKSASTFKVIANKPSVPAAARQKAVQMPLRRTMNGTAPRWTQMADMLGQNLDTPAQSRMTSIAASPAAKSPPPTPPHVRIQRDAKAKQEAQEASSSIEQRVAATATEAEAHPTHISEEQNKESVTAVDLISGEDAQQSLEVKHVEPIAVGEQSLENTEIVEQVNEQYGECQTGEQAEEQMEEHGSDDQEPTPADAEVDDSDVVSPQTPPSKNNISEAVQTDDEIKDNVCPPKPRIQAPVPPTCNNCGMDDHETSDCGVCPDCELYADGEPCSRHATSSVVDDVEQQDHSTDLSSVLKPVEPTDRVTQPEVDAAEQAEEDETPLPSSRHEATPAELIELDSSSEARSSSPLAPKDQAKSSQWRPARAPSFFAPTAKSKTIGHATQSIARPFGSLPHSTFASHNGAAVDTFAAGPFQTDWWANKQAAIGLDPSIPHGMTPAPSASFNRSTFPRQQCEMGSGPLIERQGPSSLHPHRAQPETLVEQNMTVNGCLPNPIVPPGLGGPLPGRQADFDALVGASDVPKQKQPSAYYQEIKGAQFKEFSNTFKVPEAFARKIVDPLTSISTMGARINEDSGRVPEVSVTDINATDVGRSISPTATTANATDEQGVEPEQVDPAVSDDTQGVVQPQVDPEAEKAREAKQLAKKLREARETRDKQTGGTVLIADELAKVNKMREHIHQLEQLGYDENGEKKSEGTYTGESSGSDDPNSAKQGVREGKKAAREAVKIAWVKRDIARSKVTGTWSIDRANELKAATISYNERRAELASLMADGQLHDDDAKVYPFFGNIDLSEPKCKPEGVAQLRRRIKAEQCASSSSENDTTAAAGPPAPGGEVQRLKDKLVSARTLRQQALDYFKQDPPQNDINYAKWKTAGDAKVARANAFYRKKREDLIAAFPNTGLPADLEEEFPDVL